MKQHRQNIVEVITSAYETGMAVPQYYFQRHYEEMKDAIDDQEIVAVPPMWFIKPKGIEFNYTLYWTGRKFKGGYVTLLNNYLGINRGPEVSNGATMFAAHVLKFKKAAKKLVDEEPLWLSINGILTDNGVVFWGYSEVDRGLVEQLVGDTLEGISEKFINNEKTLFPEGFVVRLNVFNAESLVITEGPEKSITAAWKAVYQKASMLKKHCWYTEALDNYMRKAYSKFMLSGELAHNFVNEDRTGHRVLENIKR
jgi:hypothetical protein